MSANHEPSDLCKNNDERIAKLEEKFVSLDKLLEERDKRYNAEWAAQRREVASAFKASETAITKQETSQHDYNEKSNEFRQTLADQNKTFITIPTYNARHDELVRRLDALEKVNAASMGAKENIARRETKNQWIIPLVIASVISVLALIVAVIGLVAMKPNIDRNTNYRQQQQESSMSTRPTYKAP